MGYTGIMNKYIFFNQTKRMMDQKNQMDAATPAYHLLKNEVNFGLLWRCHRCSKYAQNPFKKIPPPKIPPGKSTFFTFLIFYYRIN